MQAIGRIKAELSKSSQEKLAESGNKKFQKTKESRIKKVLEKMRKLLEKERMRTLRMRK